MAQPLKNFLENKPLDKTKKDPKRMSVERIYQKKTQLEHILLRPDSYIGSVEPVTQQLWVYDEVLGLNSRDVTFVPGLYKIFDEILVNAADNKQRDKSMNCIKINIDVENNTISVWNNGKGIPVVQHKVEKVFVPALIFGQLLTSSNYDDDEKKVTGGRNGYGAKLCNIFSTKFTVETACKESKKNFKQTWYDNMSRTGDSNITPFGGDEFTCITFTPDLSKFKMSTLDKDTVALMTRRAYDIAGASKGVRVVLNGKKIPLTGFRSYVDMYLKDKLDEVGNPLTVVHEIVNDRWEVCLTMSEKGFQQVSFTNSIATTKGGRHVDYVADQVVAKLIDVVKKKNKAGVAVKPFQVKNHIWLFVNCLIENPTFDSQTKENMTLQQKTFGSVCPLSAHFIKEATSCGIVESIMNWVKFKAQNQLNKKCSSVKHTKIKGVPKLDDANDAGGKNSIGCTLILTEGDSAKTLAVSGLGVVGRDRYGVFPLRGKMLNVREATLKQIMENNEINSVIKILGLQYKKNYSDPESLKTLRYGKIMIMTDQDQDGSHIKGLLINFIHHNWPSLLRHNFLEEFITPIIKVSHKKEHISFYSIPEYNAWKDTQTNIKSWRTKYYKGLGTSTSQEAKEYFSDMQKHRIPFKYGGPADDEAITLAFSKKKIEERKVWLTNFMLDRRQRRAHDLPEDFLYGQNTKSLSYNDFVNKELVLFSNSDNERSLPCLVDGLKPGQRKVLFCCFKRNDKREVKVAQLAGSVAEMSAYHHGEVSLMMTIVGLAQNFVGSNNLNMLQPMGQFGTRLHGGKDSASPRYIFTMLSPLARLIFPNMDDNLLKYNIDDNQRVEPDWYIPIIPMVLVNGAEGIGTGWASKIPNFDVREIVNNIRRMIAGEEPQPMLPNYKGFKGTIDNVVDNSYFVSGEVAIIDSTTIEISELPIKTWTQSYKENVLEPMMNGTEKVPPLITDYKEYHTDTTVRFLVKMTPEKLIEAEAAGLHKVFKLQTSLTCNSMVRFTHATASKTGKQSTLQFKAVGKKPKKSASDEESDEESDDMFDNMSDDEMDSEEEIAPRVGRASKAPVKYSMSDSEDEFDDVGKESAPKRKAVISDDDSFLPEPMADREVDSPVPPPKAKKTAISKPAAKAAQAKSSSQSGDAVPAPKAPVQRKPKAAAPKKPAAARKPAAKKSPVLDVRQPSIMDSLTKSKPVSKTAAENFPSFDSSDSEAEAKAAKAKAKPKPVVKRKQVLDDDDDSSDSSGDLMSRLKGKTTAGKKTKRWDEDENFNISDQEAVAPVATAVREVPARARKAVVYKVDSDSDSSQF
ncbi:DNA topoisomerase 2-alpha [Notothenia coriiceps]|uniref:DNA topoisomerase 2 n=1 Tax=Notothenia coriiceps TaxID=8208 RepID=A0A6I9MX53_9TELE|nr:PREDICTED: DNA topoisomerase 2-alpha [Notothenia coriiceps]